MKKIILTSAIALVMGSNVASADAISDSHDMIIKATQNKVCMLVPLASESAERQLFTSNDDGKIESAITEVFTFDDSWCNAPHTLKLTTEKDGFRNVSGTTLAAGSDNMLNVVNYVATVNHWATDLVLKTAVGGRDITSDLVTGGFRNDGKEGNRGDRPALNVTLVVGAKRPPLLAGDYEDTLTLTLTPNI